ncbi:hypothetical protein CC85DRAFT_273777 [Cutaneotrichosporon oleaginosum]|uniref:Uncharacterized protein n=1 Tax=Cutaneotrichosporon oleaginosum TaxID=879819 RepID=A0A0J0XP10_9TREE|nr:uncharacterized protein CC85DRAFT_273777 [Cutaneotrichosporon oleaginosum]KLT42835.1 hypothetical protein CC85DRAFT_273777 [Cutaneotrichosporon oleaginosum]
MVKPIPRKLVVVGDGGCGKSSLLTVFTKGFFPTNYEPTVFENYIETVDVDGQPVELSLWDTAGQEDFDRLRSLSYLDTHVVLVCFSVDDPVSLENVEEKWGPEVNKHCPGVKIILTALKCDLRDNEKGDAQVSHDDGLAAARKLKASRYLECSAKANRGVQETIIEAARLSLSSRAKGAPRRSLPSCCVIS